MRVGILPPVRRGGSEKEGGRERKRETHHTKMKESTPIEKKKTKKRERKTRERICVPFKNVFLCVCACEERKECAGFAF